MVQEISFELVVFTILKNYSEGLQQKELINKICEKVKIGRTRAREEIIKLTYPVVSIKDVNDVYPALIHDKDFNINSSRIFRIYKLNTHWINQNESDYKKFLDNHVNCNFELIIS
jgi:hypothetical protein